MTLSVITEQLDVPGATLPFRLEELTNAHLVTQEHDGRNLIYRVVYDHMNALLDFLTANCRQGEAYLEANTIAYKC